MPAGNEYGNKGTLLDHGLSAKWARLFEVLNAVSSVWSIPVTYGSLSGIAHISIATGRQWE